MQLVDSHCHVSADWYEPVETLLDQMDRNGVAQAVLIQMLGQLDNDYQQRCVRRHPRRFVSVVAVDAERPDACDKLAALAAEGTSGVRLRPGTRSPGADPLAIWRTAAVLGLAVSCVGTAEEFASPEFFELLETLPELPVALEHLGGSGRPEATDLEIRRRVFDAARYPNVFLKLPGLGELLPRASLEPRDRVPAACCVELDEALARFGPERLMWGSDFPVVCAREGYANALGWIRERVAARSSDAVRLVFGDTARRVFKLP